MISGAAIPLAPQELKPRKGKQVKCECFTCGWAVWTTPTRCATLPVCGKCWQLERVARLCLPSRLEDCETLAPEHLGDHPLARYEDARHDRALQRAGRVSRGMTGAHECATLGCHDTTIRAGGYCPRCAEANAQHEYVRTGRKPLKAKVTVTPLRELLPETRAERAARIRNERALNDLPF